ncbi:hypothetical protein L596_021483 [Steinernema carpocapsae]|uniref:Uncharacterized protein n=1 Tax=Steinernema carpocapsae TaxID=34508 RepID=A0A4U5MIX5_STECR|nr:hypothetical protein L596_021483 [Steinernema carpocapsae]
MGSQAWENRGDRKVFEKAVYPLVSWQRKSQVFKQFSLPPFVLQCLLSLFISFSHSMAISANVLAIIIVTFTWIIRLAYNGNRDPRFVAIRFFGFLCGMTLCYQFLLGLKHFGINVI